MSSAWKKVETSLFVVQAPANWVIEEMPGGTLLAQDERGEVKITIAAIPRASGGEGTGSAATELNKWLGSQGHVKFHYPPRWVGGTPCPTATVEGLEILRAGVAWWRRALRIGPRKLWRFWTVVHPQMVLLISCGGPSEVVEQQRGLVDRLVLSASARETELLQGRPFTEKVVSLARSYFPQTAVAVIDAAHLKFGSRQVSVIKLHRQYMASPENLSTQVRAFFAEVQGEGAGAGGGGSWSSVRSRVMPALVAESTLKDASPAPLQESWINGLSIIYVLEGGGPDRTITLEDARRWKVTAEMLHEQALQNLVGQSHEQTMEGHRAEGYTMLVLGTPDKHNAARILLPELHRKLREHLGPTFYAAMPTREFLLAFSTGKEEILAQVRQQIGADYSRARAGLSKRLFLVTPDGIAGDPGEEESFDW